jgi:sec-independent protein translocase protein TatA
MFGNTIGPWEIAIVLLIALLVFGPKKLPELGKGLGRGMRDFKRAVSGDDDEERKAEEEAKKAEKPQIVADTTVVAAAPVTAAEPVTVAPADESTT